MKITVFLFVLPLLVGVPLQAADSPPYRILVDISAVPEAASYVQPVTSLLHEWYPKINRQLFGDAALPFRDVRVIFEKVTEVDTDSGRQQAPSYTNANVIHVNYPNLTHMSDDYRGMLIHELTHVVQNYSGLTRFDARWVGEGIADYIRHKTIEKDLLPKLLWDDDGT